MNAEDEENWNQMIQKAKDMGATDEQILEVFGEFDRTPNIYDRQAEWVRIFSHIITRLLIYSKHMPIYNTNMEGGVYSLNQQ